MAKAKEKEKYDPFMITDDEIAETKSAVSQGSSGVICPKRNKSINGSCKVCDYIQTQIYSKKLEKTHPAMNWARSKKAKLTWFMNIVLPENPNVAMFLEVGDKAGNQIVDGIENKGWRDIVHPHKGVGRELLCTKSKKSGDEWPTYTISPVLDKADWEIPEKVWKNVPDLRNIITTIEEGGLTDDNYMHVRSLKMDETLRFRMCPPAQTKDGEKKCVIAPVFRHWGVTEDQVNGTESLNWKEIEEDSPFEEAGETEEKEKLDLSFQNEKEKNEEKAEESPSKGAKETKKPPCFGNDKFFEEDDTENCVPCAFFKMCGKEIAKG